MRLYRRCSRFFFDAFRNGAKRFYRIDRNTVQESEPFTQKKWSQNPKSVGSYRRFIFDAFRRYNPSKNTFSFFKSNSRNPQLPIPSNPVFQNVVRNHQLRNRNRNRNSPFLDGAKRFYSKNTRTSTTEAPHPFIARVLTFLDENARAFKSIIIFVSGFLMAATFGSTETVPYTNRSHFVLLSTSFEKFLGEVEFKKIKEKYGEKVLPPSHSDSIRVLEIAHRIIDVVKSKTRHLEGLEWEVIVVDDPAVNAFCLPGGKIVVFTGLLRHFEEDAEIATILGHEVGHAVARHSAEKVYRILWQKILQLIFYEYYKPEVVDITSQLLLNLPHSRRCEVEADYIGLILIASAGYDPCVAPHVYEKLSKVGGNVPFQDYISTHPSGKKRSELLTQPKVMEEALSIYREMWCIQ